jgi:uncharacterized protein
MKLQEHQTARMNLVARYGTDQVQINGQTLTAPCMVAPGLLEAEWINSPDAITREALAKLWPLEPQVVLVGIARRDHPSMKLLKGWFAERQIAAEVMDLGAACRTYNVLAQEERPVAALLFPESR